MWLTLLTPLALLFLQAPSGPPRPAEADFVVPNFRFTSGETLPQLKIHYRTWGTPKKDAQGIVRNAVLVMHGTGGTGGQFAGATFAGELFGPGQPLDVAQFYVIAPDDIGHGQSSKPSDGLRATFPRYGYLDMLEAEHRLLVDGLGVNHLRLVMGTSMGGMHTWLWGERYPDMMDALMPLASLPTQIAGRNRVWRRAAIDAIRSDPEWMKGNYTAQPRGLRTVAQLLWLVGSNPILRQKAMPTLAAADKDIDAYVDTYVKTGDANDILYALESSRDYDPGPDLEKIKAPLLAVNSADDLVNPPELQILEKEIVRVPRGRAVVLPLSDKTAGHGTHTLASVWRSYLEDLLRTSAAPATSQAAAGPNPDIHYQLGPDSLPRADVPKGEVRGPFVIQSQAYPGTQHTYWVYVPAQYDRAIPASLMIFNDGQAFMNMQGDIRAPNVLDNLIERREIPVMLAVFINPGRRPDQPEPTPQEWGDRTTNRPTEYNTLDDKYARVVVDELMPALDKEYNIAKDPDRRGIGGASSGAIAAFSVAWERPDQFRKVLSIVGSFTNIRGGHAYSDIVGKTERKPIRVFLQDGRNDNRGVRADGTYDETRDWFANNVKLMRALTEKGYDVNYTWGIGRHGQKQGGAILPDMMRWLWRDHPVSTDVNDSVERAFNTGPAGAKKGGQ
jgi:homoserine O-acetyltransferase/O-succinyltransferase